MRWEIFRTEDPEDIFGEKAVLYLRRLQIKGGWLVMPCGCTPGGMVVGGGMAFVPDENHLWNVDAIKNDEGESNVRKTK